MRRRGTPYGGKGSRGGLRGQWGLAALLVLCLSAPLPAQPQGFTREDRERLVRLEATLQTFMRQIDKRFEQIDKRFEQIDKRFEQIDKRFEQIDKRFETVDRRFAELRADMNARFAQVDRRFEDMNHRLAFIQQLLVAMMAVFGGLCGVFVGLLLWDRRTFKELCYGLST